MLCDFFFIRESITALDSYYYATKTFLICLRYSKNRLKPLLRTKTFSSFEAVFLKSPVKFSTYVFRHLLAEKHSGIN